MPNSSYTFLIKSFSPSVDVSIGDSNQGIEQDVPDEIKKNVDEPIEKNIGRIFRKHNIVEYKSPTDYLSVDDFYKVYALKTA